MRVLIVDDDPILIMVCTRIMKITGFSEEVASAKEGREGMDYLYRQLQEAPDNLPELILLDINMPVLNGWEFLDEFIALLPKLPVEIPVYMLSSTIDQADFDKAETYSVVKGFYSKPLTRENLVEIETLIG
jgi:CheY-like chemotaxis protein